ncbi:hypothetical protein [Jeotgalibaca porci]|uniref:hypothetical protein n=1 Tax=Jeotgalibaca porci TaxID=1868793 RepID=UPI00359FA9D1
MKVRDKHDTASSMGAHQYANIELIEIDGILRVRKKSTKEIMPMSLGLTAKRTYRKNKVGGE